jgi:hypothetical protein
MSLLLTCLDCAFAWTHRRKPAGYLQRRRYFNIADVHCYRALTAKATQSAMSFLRQLKTIDKTLARIFMIARNIAENIGRHASRTDFGNSHALAVAVNA